MTPNVVSGDNVWERCNPDLKPQNMIPVRHNIYPETAHCWTLEQSFIQRVGGGKIGYPDTQPGYSSSR